MEDETSKDKRKYSRYETDIKINFSIRIDLKTKVDYKVIEGRSVDLEYHSGVSRNVSAEGLCFFSHEKLEAGTILQIEVYVPSSANPIEMEGEVCWSKLAGDQGPGSDFYDTGVKIVTVNGKNVAESITLDSDHKVMWSAVLDSIFSSFKHIVPEIDKNK